MTSTWGGEPGTVGEMPPTQDGISVVIPVLDDRAGLALTLAALGEQRRLPDEVIVVDGGSRDGSADLARRWDDARLAVRVVRAPGASIGGARNAGVRAARHSWVACTDATCVPVSGWLAAIDAQRPHADFVAGIVLIAADNALQRILAVTHYPSADELDAPPRWVAVSHRLFGRAHTPDRVGGGSMAFSVAAWRAAGGLPEGHHAGEDRGFVLAVMAAGLRVVRARDAAVHWPPPPTWRGNVRQFHRYARGDVRLRGRARHGLRAAAWVLTPAAVLRGGARTRAACALLGLSYLALPIRRARAVGLPTREWCWRMPLAIVVKDLAQVGGAVAGVLDATRAARAARDAATSRSAAGERPPSPPDRARRAGTTSA